MRKYKKTLFYIELPPPIHGMTYLNKIIFDEFKTYDTCNFYNTNFTDNVSDIGSSSLFKVFRNIKIIIKSWKKFFLIKPDKVYIVLSATKFGIIRDFLILLPSIVFNKKRILHLHGFTYFDVYQNSLLYKFLFKIISYKSILIVLCNTHKNRAYQVFNHKNIYILYNTLQKNIKVEYKNIHSPIRLLYISNISKDKGIIDLMKSVQNIENIELTIAGNFWKDKEEFMLILKESENINYIGFADEEKKQELFSTHDIFCLPSKLNEGSPISIIEAMAYGLPVISTNKGCIKEMINSCGIILSDNFDKSEFLEAINKVIKNYEVFSMNAIKNYHMFYIREVFVSSSRRVLCAE